jgi:hypothetical protein
VKDADNVGRQIPMSFHLERQHLLSHQLIQGFKEEIQKLDCFRDDWTLWFIEKFMVAALQPNFASFADVREFPGLVVFAWAVTFGVLPLNENSLDKVMFFAVKPQDGIGTGHSRAACRLAILRPFAKVVTVAYPLESQVSLSLPNRQDSVRIREELLHPMEQ